MESGLVRLVSRYWQLPVQNYWVGDWNKQVPVELGKSLPECVPVRKNLPDNYRWLAWCHKSCCDCQQFWQNTPSQHWRWSPDTGPVGFGPLGIELPDTGQAGFGSPDTEPVGFGPLGIGPLGIGSPDTETVGFGPLGIGSPDTGPEGFELPDTGQAGFGPLGTALSGTGSPGIGFGGIGDWR